MPLYSIKTKEVEVNLSPEEAKEFHQYVVHQENMLVPMNIKTQKPFCGFRGTLV
ncbi:hypothetical protein F6Y05_32630 [Bacillus megaterium]|nr:hypothetical protein [Priestia megaterium]